MRFLENSERERDRLVNERRAERRRQWRRLQWVAGALALLLFISGVTTYVARRESQRARAESDRAERNLQLARAAVDESLAGRRARAVAPRRRRAGDRRVSPRAAARRRSASTSTSSSRRRRARSCRREIAFAQLRLGPHRSGARCAGSRRTTDYRSAITAFAALTQAYPARAEYRSALADAYNWLGESLRRAGGRYAEAKAAYDKALELAAGPVAAAEMPAQQTGTGPRALQPGDSARQPGRPGRRHLDAAEADLREAIRLLEPLARSSHASRPRRTSDGPTTTSAASWRSATDESPKRAISIRGPCTFTRT